MWFQGKSFSNHSTDSVKYIMTKQQAMSWSSQLYVIVTITMMQSLCIQSYNTTQVSRQPFKAIEDNTNKNTCSDDTECAPWTACQNSTCVCRQNENQLSIQCNTENLQLEVPKCSCVTYNNKTREITAGKCIEGCSNATFLYNSYLPKDPSGINTFMCKMKWNRTGRLCWEMFTRTCSISLLL